MKQKIKDGFLVVLIIFALVFYFILGYEILNILDIGADGS